MVGARIVNYRPESMHDGFRNPAAPELAFAKNECVRAAGPVMDENIDINSAPHCID